MERNSSLMSLNAHSTWKKGRSKVFNLALLPLHPVLAALRDLVSSTVNSRDGNGQTPSRRHLSRLVLADSPPGRITCRNGRCQNRWGRVLPHVVVRVIC
uniref:Uncharacterized protein n=1 Tax=Cryptococcus bacillisporus CA1280 TaxID=1296109 RepID=A0A0D0VWW6_CRYGA|nr:hypothetical protein I312_00994 [Cryptococcus bacillisporus CA1280]